MSCVLYGRCPLRLCPGCSQTKGAKFQLPKEVIIKGKTVISSAIGGRRDFCQTIGSTETSDRGTAKGN